MNINKIIFSFKRYDGIIYDHLLIDTNTPPVKTHTYKGYKLPYTLNLTD